MLQMPSRDRRVEADRQGVPRTIVLGHDRLRITQVEGVREEVAAYPVGDGPRTLFIVRAGGRRFRVVHQHRERRWEVEPLARGPMSVLTFAA